MGTHRMPRFTETELSKFKHQLELRRDEILSLEGEMESEGLKGWSGQETGELVYARLHPADLGTDEFERNLSLSLAENEVREVQDIEEALLKIQNETYGICQNCANEIASSRLEALPYARFCGDCAHKMERRQRQISKKGAG